MFTSSALVSAAIAVSGVATAGDEIAPAPAALAPSNNGSWCDGFKTVGKFYSNDNDPFIQELKFFGRLQWQAAHINGDDVNGDSFSDTIDDYRRMRFGAQIKFLNSFKLKGNLNLVDEDAKDGGGREFGYQNWDQLKLSYSKKDVAGFDEVSLTYGRHKVKVGHESHTSSKKIKTVERSPLSNKIYDGRGPVSLWVLSAAVGRELSDTSARTSPRRLVASARVRLSTLAPNTRLVTAPLSLTSSTM